MMHYTSANLTKILCFLLLVAYSLPGGSHAEEDSTDFFEQQKLTSRLLVDMLLDNINSSGLTLFDQPITRDHLRPHQVAYVHNLADDSLEIRAHFRLAEEFVVPDYEDYVVDQISMVVDKDGNIQAVNAHVVPRAENVSPAQ